MRSATVANAYDAMPPAPSASASASDRTSPTRPMNLPAPRPPAIAPAPWNAPSTPRKAPRRWRPSCTTAKGMTSARPTPPAPKTTAGRMARNTGVVKKCRNPARSSLVRTRPRFARAMSGARTSESAARGDHERAGVDDRHEAAAREHVEARARDGRRDADARASALEHAVGLCAAARRAASRRPGRCGPPRPPAARSRRPARPRR